ncbi:MAG: Bacterial regulatory protein tetR family [Chloroflexota bacterium]|nr:Bacterial regulatory protein tetR family [Chloroflexota bacterium]
MWEQSVTERDHSVGPRPTAPRKRDPKDKADRLMHAAIDLMDELGYPHTTIHEICRRAGVSIGTFYAQFDSKAELIARAATADEALTFSAADLREPLRIEATIEEFLGGPRGRLWRTWREAVLSEPTLAEREEDLAREVRARLVAAITEARRAAGITGSPADSAGLAWLIFGMVREALRHGPGRPEDVAPLLAHAIWRLVMEAGPAPDRRTVAGARP